VSSLGSPQVEGGKGSLETLSDSHIKPQHWIIGKKFAVILAVLSDLSGSVLNPVLKAASSHS
jgi:hypothetical protein